MKIDRIVAAALCALVWVLASCQVVRAQQSSEEEESALAKQSQNPVGDLISLPFQSNNSFNIGDNDRTRSILNIQPVIPVNAGPFNIINRVIFPLLYQPDISQPSGGTFGTSDTTYTAFFTPAKPGKLIWGAGPVALVPTRFGRPARRRQVGAGTVGGRVDDARAVGCGRDCQPDLVNRRRRRPLRCQQLLVSVLHQLQPGGWLVPHQRTYHHRQLGGRRRQHVDRALRGRVRQGLSCWQPGDELQYSSLLQRRPARHGSQLESRVAHAVELPVSEIELETIGTLERGLVLYLRQEGRGIGFINKVKAYALQDEGLDTVEANLVLGFRDDERDYAIAAHRIMSLNVKSIELMTNNPRKVEQLTHNGVHVSRRLPQVIPPNGHNRFYLETKRDRSPLHRLRRQAPRHGAERSRPRRRHARDLKPGAATVVPRSGRF